MSIPGSGLLAALRGRNKSVKESPVQVDESKFAARSSAVHALEQAVAAGSAQESSRKSPKGCSIPSGSAEFVYNLEGSHPGEEQHELAVSFFIIFHYSLLFK